jgi:hypothetical protein
MFNGSFSPSPWVERKRRLTRLGWILILLGVIGEGLFEGATSWADSKLQDWSNTLLLNAEALTGNAAKSAKIAHEEANAVKGIADEARADAKDALVKAQAAQRELAHAETDANKAQTLATNALATATEASSSAARAAASLEKAEAEAKGAESSASNALALATGARREVESFKDKLVSAEHDLDALRDRVQPRHISEDKKKALVDKLLPCFGEKPAVQWTSDAFDGQIYGQDFMDVFSRAGCPVGSKFGQVWMTTHLVGVQVAVHDGTMSNVPQFAQQVLKSLNSKEVGIPAKPAVDASVPEGSFAIRIGAKE